MRYFTCWAQKINSHCFTWFLFLDKIQDGGQDGNHLWWRHRPPAAPPPIKYTLSCREDLLLKIKGFQRKAKIVSKYCNISKTQGGSINRPPAPPPSPPCTMVGLWLCVYVRGLKPEGNWVEWTFAKTSGAVTRDSGEREKKLANSQF